TAQRLQLPTRALMRLYAQGLIQGRHLRDIAPTRTPSDAAAPVERTEQTHDLARDKALAPQGGSTGRAGRPDGRLLRPFGEYSFNEVEHEHTGQRPRGQYQRHERLGLFERTEYPLHGGIILSYAVAEA